MSGSYWTCLKQLHVQQQLVDDYVPGSFFLDPEYFKIVFDLENRIYVLPVDTDLTRLLWIGRVL